MIQIKTLRGDILKGASSYVYTIFTFVVIKEIRGNLHTLPCIICQAANNLLIQYMEQRRLDRENKNKEQYCGGGGVRWSEIPKVVFALLDCRERY